MIRILLALVAATLAFSATAQDTLKKIKDGGTITVGHRDASVPFSYYDDKQQPIGYSMDLCMKIVDAVKADLKMPKLEVKYQLVTSANRIPLMANGTIDLECGSTTNNIPRQEQVWFTITHFVTANRWIAKKSANIKTLADLKGKTIVSTAGTTNIKQITEINAAQSLGMNIISANGHPEAFQMFDDFFAIHRLAVTKCVIVNQTCSWRGMLLVVEPHSRSIVPLAMSGMRLAEVTSWYFTSSLGILRSALTASTIFMHKSIE